MQRRSNDTLYRFALYRSPKLHRFLHEDLPPLQQFQQLSFRILLFVSFEEQIEKKK